MAAFVSFDWSMGKRLVVAVRRPRRAWRFAGNGVIVQS
jgi:hypothetical protein